MRPFYNTKVDDFRPSTPNTVDSFSNHPSASNKYRPEENGIAVVKVSRCGFSLFPRQHKKQRSDFIRDMLRASKITPA